MKILIFHPVLLPPRDYGGTERVVLWLARGLLERGHEVLVAARSGSILPRGARLCAVPPGRESPSQLKRLIGGKDSENLDVVHFMGPPGADTLEKLPFPAVFTLHGNGQPGETFPMNTVFLSADHARRHGGRVFIWNGIDPEELFFSTAPRRDEMLFLSKTNWSVKNLPGAVRICEKAGVRLRIAGGNRPLRLRLRALLEPAKLAWEGPVAGSRKARVLAEARALVFPVLWPEPFGLVVAEALMSGTPVIASPRGSLPELISPEVGALPETDEQWVEALRGSNGRWKAEACRDWALRNFHYQRMAEQYEQVYRKVIAGERLHETAPQARGLTIARTPSLPLEETSS